MTICNLTNVDANFVVVQKQEILDKYYSNSLRLLNYNCRRMREPYNVDDYLKSRRQIWMTLGSQYHRA